MNNAKTSILFAAMLSLLVTPAIMEDAFAAERIPDFMKKNIEWYATGQISEDEFVNALTYLMNIDVIVLDEGRADAIKELREENKQLRIALEQCQQACGTDSGVGFDSSAGAGISASAGDSGTSAGAGFKAGAGMSAGAGVSASAGVSPSTETTESHQLGPEVIQKKHITNLDVQTMRVQIGDSWHNFVVATQTDNIPMDINALVQAALRESYLEQNKDLEFYAEKVQHYNDLKEAIRNEITEMRAAKSVAPFVPGGAVISAAVSGMAQSVQVMDQITSANEKLKNLLEVLTELLNSFNELKANQPPKTILNDNGEEIPNPAYDVWQNRLINLQNQIDVILQQIQETQQELDALQSQLSSAISEDAAKLREQQEQLRKQTEEAMEAAAEEANKAAEDEDTASETKETATKNYTATVQPIPKTALPYP